MTGPRDDLPADLVGAHTVGLADGGPHCRLSVGARWEATCGSGTLSVCTPSRCCPWWPSYWRCWHAGYLAWPHHS